MAEISPLRRRMIDDMMIRNQSCDDRIGNYSLTGLPDCAVKRGLLLAALCRSLPYWPARRIHRSRIRSEFRPDPRRCRSVKAIGRLAAAALVIGTIVDEGVGDAVGAIKWHKVSGLFPRFAAKPSARPLLRLREAVDTEPVRVARVIGRAERL